MLRKQKSVIIIVGMFLIFNILTSSSFAQGIPQTINFQGILKDSGGTIVPDGNYDFTFRIYSQETGGSVLWPESHINVPVSNGVYNVVLGSITLLDLPFDEQYWLGISVETDPEMARIKLTSVPTAFNSINAESAEKIQGQPVSITSPTNGQVLEWNGSEWAASTIAPVATTGSYNDLQDTPTLATVASSGNYSDLNGTPALKTVATSGSYNDLSGKPTLSSVAASGNYSDLNGTPALKTVATSGSYNDLSDKPTLSSVAASGNYSDLNGTPALKTVATSGSYNDLSNKPAIPDTSNFVTISDSQSITGSKTFLSSISVGNSSTSRIVDIYTSSIGLKLYRVGGSQFGDIRTNSNDDFILRAPNGELRTQGDLYLQYSGTSSWNDLYAGEVELHDYLNFNTSTGQTVGRMYANGSSGIRMSFDSGDHLEISGDLEVTGAIDVDNVAKIYEYSSGEGAVVVKKDGNNIGELYATSTGYGHLELRRNTSNGYGVQLSANYSNGAGLGLYNSSGTRTIRILAGDGKGYASNGWEQSSDERLKENIESIDNALDKVLKLRGVSFEWKDRQNHPEGKQIGFIAQEVKEVLPSVVSDGEFYSLDYARITSVLVEAVKEQQTEIETLKTQYKTEIESLKAELADLKTKIQ